MSKASSRMPKKAERVAEQIEREILEGGLPTGHRIGNEPELIERYGVSRAVLREAIRLVERHQLAETRRGNRGGLFVAQPAEDSISRVLCSYLESVGLSLDELFEARRLIEPVLVRHAADRATPEEAEQLAAILLARPDPGSISGNADLFDRFFAQLGEAAQSPALGLFARTLHRAAQHVAMGRQFGKQGAADAYRLVWEAQMSITRAISEHDAELAAKRIRRLLAREERDWRKLPRRKRPPPPRVLKRGDTLARIISERIRREGRKPGDRLGSEPELIEHYGVSRAALREAIRMLEQHRIAEMRRGLEGGLIVTEPDPRNAIRTASLYLRHVGMAIGPIREARLLLEPAGAALAAERASDSQLAELAAEHVRTLTLEGIESARASRDLHERIADASGNRALALFTRVMITASWGPSSAPAPKLPKDAIEQIRVANTRIVRALHDRKPDEASRLLQRHLETSLGWWSALHPV